MAKEKDLDRLKRTQNTIKVLLVTEEYHITGDLRLPIHSVVENPTNENLLFYALNCGNMFIALENCTVMRKKEVEYLPEHIKYYNVNLNIVHSCKIIED
ncbi:MAG: hypothetical protein E7Z87_02570 [Cyanobacteria bacterium SIG26]|nr:hypothetical protein [Cyanobacteria bacterium SIG26]